MMLQFVEESGLILDENISNDQIEDVISSFVDVLDIANSQNEIVKKFSEVYFQDIQPNKQLYNFLYDVIEHDDLQEIKDLLSQALDSLPDWDEETDFNEIEATIDGFLVLSPTLAHALNIKAQKEAVGCVVFSSSNRNTVCKVKTNQDSDDVHFIANLKDRYQFFRDLIQIEEVNHHRFPEIAPKAFPSLLWVEGVWNELRSHHRCFFGHHLPTLLNHLSVLNDHTPRLFFNDPGGVNLNREFDSLGIDASNENGHTRNINKCQKDRTRSWRGVDAVFWWHTKITPLEGRIHFIHEQQRPNTNDPLEGRIVVGIFTNHCYLPNN